MTDEPTEQSKRDAAVRAMGFHAGQVWDSTAGLLAAFAITFGETFEHPPLWRDLPPAQQREFTATLPHVFGPVCTLQAALMRKAKP